MNNEAYVARDRKRIGENREKNKPGEYAPSSN